MKKSLRNAFSNPGSSQRRYLSPRPKWLHTSKASVKSKGTEMVMLSKDSPLSNMPAELQLDTIYFLPYDDVLALKKTSRYFHYFISPQILQECKQTQIDRWAEHEKRGGWPDQFPCYACLQLKPKTEFFINNTYASNRATPGTADTDRHCILCSFKNGKYRPGTRLNVSGQSWVLCACCGELKCTLGLEKVCPPCKASFDLRHTWGYFLRFCQFFFAIVIWGLACSGKLPPRTSVAKKHSLRFIFESLVCITTIGATMNSLLIRGETRKLHGYRTKRQQNGKFVLRVEVVGLLAWLGILGAVINEGIHLHFGGRFDKIAKAMLSMIVLQCGCFVLSAWWGYRTSLQRRNVRKRWGQYAEIEA